MAATVVSALSNVTLANNNTGFSVWKRDGTGGTPSAVSETDVFIQGTGACSVKVSNQGVVLAFATGGLNLSAANTHVYIWVNMLAGGLMATRANSGLCICLSSDATLSSGSNYSFWAVDGSDTYPGGWVRYVIDVSKTRTQGAGTLNLSSVQHIGVYCDTRPNVAKFDNLVIDRIDYTAGPGLRVYGTSTTDDLFGDIVAADEGTVGNKYGVVTTKSGVIYCRGRIELGDDAGTNSSDLTAADKIIVFEDPLYYNGSSVVSAISATLYRLDVKGNGTGTTSLVIGKKVGTGDTASGRNGLTILSAGPNVSMSLDDGQVNTLKIYGTIFRNIKGALSWGSNTAHECMGNTFDNCVQFDPVGGVQIRDCVMSNYNGTLAALLWNSSIDIKNCSFIANTDTTNDPAAIEHTSAAGSPYTYNGLLFNGNKYDVRNSAGSAITVNKSGGANPATFIGSSVTFSASFVLTLNNIPEGVQVTIVNSSTRTELQNSNAPASGIVTYTHSGGETVDIMFMDVDYDPNVSDIFNLTLPNADSSIQVSMLDDPNYANP